MSKTHHSASARSSAADALDAPRARLTIAGLTDGTVETVPDLRVRGRADEIADELREVHLPALEEAGYIEWDRESGTISPGPNFDEAAAHVSGLAGLQSGSDDD